MSDASTDTEFIEVEAVARQPAFGAAALLMAVIALMSNAFAFPAVAAISLYTSARSYERSETVWPAIVAVLLIIVGVISFADQMSAISDGLA